MNWGNNGITSLLALVWVAGQAQIKCHVEGTLETDFPRLYEVFFLKQYERGSWFAGKFIAENCDVNVTMYEDKRVSIVTGGEEGRKHAVKDSIEDVRFWNLVEEIDNQLENPDRRTEYYKADFLSTIAKARAMNVDSLPRTYVDSVRQVIQHCYDSHLAPSSPLPPMPSNWSRSSRLRLSAKQCNRETNIWGFQTLFLKYFLGFHTISLK